jgi:O-antigen biosynthesis protein WbqP
MYKKCIKGFLDFTISFFAVIALSPLFILLALLIKLESKGNVFFKQDRVGKNKIIFKCYKFRTMYSDTPSNVPTHMLNNPQIYITKIGKFLRLTSLDELPQIINILQGKMSIIGPRPALYNQYDLVEERDKYGANDVRPGLTGLAQIKGRDELEIPVKAKYDGDYVQNLSLKNDIKIFVKTIISVLKHEGVEEGSHKHDDSNNEKEGE